MHPQYYGEFIKRVIWTFYKNFKILDKIWSLIKRENLSLFPVLKISNTS